MKKITKTNVKKTLEKNRSLVKGTADPTRVYVFMGHPIDSYFGTEAKHKMALHSLTDGGMLNVDIEGEEIFYLVESESDVLHDMNGPVEKDSYKDILSRIEKVFGK